MGELLNIVITGFNTPKLDVSCVRSIINGSSYKPYMITYFDNSYRNYNLSNLWNRRIEQSPSDYICILNNDTEVIQSDCMSRLMETIRKRNVGAVGPSTNNAGNFQKLGNSKVPLSREEVDTRKEFGYDWQLSAFCILIKRDAWYKAGKFSPRFGHYGQDSDLMLRMQVAGYKTIWRKDAFIYHIGKSSSKRLLGFDDLSERRKADKIYRSEVKILT